MARGYGDHDWTDSRTTLRGPKKRDRHGVCSQEAQKLQTREGEETPTHDARGGWTRLRPHNHSQARTLRRSNPGPLPRTLASRTSLQEAEVSARSRARSQARPSVRKVLDPSEDADGAAHRETH